VGGRSYRFFEARESSKWRDIQSFPFSSEFSEWGGWKKKVRREKRKKPGACNVNEAGGRVGAGAFLLGTSCPQDANM